MIMYHGTIKGYADSILAEGIKPMPSQSFHVRDIHSPKGIYLTPHIKLATTLAKIREGYSQVEPGEMFGEFDIFNPMWKNPIGQPKLEGVDTTPVILKVDIPAEIEARLEPDPDFIGLDEKAYRCDCSIPPEAVKEVIPVTIPNGGNL